MLSHVKDLLFEKVRGVVARRKRSAVSPKLPRRLVLQELEDRSVPSATGVETDAYPDTSGSSNSSGYGWSGYKWAQSSDGYYHITYSYYDVLNGQLNGLSASTVKEVIQEALGLWASYAPLIFTETTDSGVNDTTDQSYSASGSADIRFASTYIDGANNTLAYTYYPSSTSDGLSGDVIFDNSENWSTNPKNGLDLLEVATHEIGHALGLGHSYDTSAIMYPYYAGRFSGLGTGYLSSSDISAIQSVYGAASGSVTPLSSIANVTGNSGGGSKASFQVSGSTLIVNGTAGDDTIYYIAGTTSQTVSIDGQNYTIDPSKITKVYIVGYGGDDTLYVFGSSDDDSVVLCPGYGAISSKDYYAYWTGIEVVCASGGGGKNSVTFSDTPNSDAFVGTPSYSYMIGNGYFNFASGFGTTAASSAGSGTDVAFFFGSTGNDTYVGGPSSSSLGGSGYYITASGFSNNIAYGGGNDVAYYIGSTGNDTFVGTPWYSYLYGSGYIDLTTGFATNIAYGGGNDAAYYIDGSGSNVFVVSSGTSYMYGSGYINMGVGFSSSTGYAFNGSSDSAYLLGSGYDGFTAYQAYAILYGSGYTGVGYGFSSVYLYGAGSGNTASLYSYSYYLAVSGSWS
jgi:predicted Zn-dependent protease